MGTQATLSDKSQIRTKFSFQMVRIRLWVTSMGVPCNIVYTGMARDQINPYHFHGREERIDRDDDDDE